MTFQRKFWENFRKFSGLGFHPVHHPFSKTETHSWKKSEKKGRKDTFGEAGSTGRNRPGRRINNKGWAWVPALQTSGITSRQLWRLKPAVLTCAKSEVWIRNQVESLASFAGGGAAGRLHSSQLKPSANVKKTWASIPKTENKLCQIKILTESEIYYHYKAILPIINTLS